MDITLPFIGLRDEQVGNVSANTILIADSISSKDLLKTIKVSSAHRKLLQDTHFLALIKARSQFCLLIIEIISGAALPSSFNRPTWSAARSP